MNSKKNIKWLSLLLTGLMMMGLLGSCATTTPAATTNPAATTSPATTKAPAGTSAATTAPAKVTEFTLFINMTWFWTDKWVGIIPDTLTEKTGVKMNVTRAADDKQLGLMIASDDLPDLVFTDNISRLSDAKYCYDYDSLISKYASDWKPTDMQVMIARTKSSDGKFYYLPNEVATEEDWRNAKAGAPIYASLLVREDIMKALGNPPLNNMDDLMSIYAQVKAKYPDIVPLVFDKDWQTTYFENQLGVPMYYPLNLPVYKADDGQIKYITGHPKYKNYLQFTNKMYQNGYFTAENYAFKNASESEAFITAGTCFSYAHSSNGAVQRNAMSQKTNPNITWKAVNPTLGGADVQLISSGTGWCGTFITKKNKNPDVAIKFLEYMYSLEGQKLSEWGREGIEWKMGDDGLPKFIDEWKTATLDNAIFYTKFNPAFIFGITPTVEAAGRALNDTDAVSEYNAKVRAAVKIQPELNLVLPKADTDTYNTLTKLEAMRVTQEVKCILSANNTEFETNYANLIKQTESMGVADLNKAFATNLKNLPK